MYQVIIADDEAKIRSGLANFFPRNQLGSEITGSFSNGRDAYDFALSTPVDPILSDIRMPLMGGSELSERLLSQKKVKTIFFNGFQDSEYVRKTLRNGVFDYLLKLVKYEDLADYLTRVKELLDNEEGQDMPDICEGLSYYEKIITTVRDYLDTDYQDATLEQAARLVSLSPNHLSKIMKGHSDISFSDYLLKTRMENAVRMLMDIDCKQYKIVYRVGYDNPRNFSRVLHQYFSMTPTQYRSRGSRPESHPRHGPASLIRKNAKRN